MPALGVTRCHAAVRIFERGCRRRGSARNRIRSLNWRSVLRRTQDLDSCERGFEVAAVGPEQAGEQLVRAPVFDPVTAEPDLEVAELVEHRGA